MVDEIVNPLKMTPDMQARLEGMEADIERGKKAIEALKTMGMDTSAIEDKITWAEETRKTLLEQFTE